MRYHWLVNDLRRIADTIERLSSNDDAGLPPPRLGGTAELSVTLNVNQTTVNRWAERRESTGFPRPVLELRMGAVYDVDEVCEWYQRWSDTRKQ